jgi:hypothetical protein
MRAGPQRPSTHGRLQLEGGIAYPSGAQRLLTAANGPGRFRARLDFRAVQKIIIGHQNQKLSQNPRTPDRRAKNGL